MCNNIKLTEKDMKIMNEYNLNYGSGSETVPHHILHHWQDGKSKHLFKLFGDKLIHEKEITYGLSSEDYERVLLSDEDFKSFKKDVCDKYRMSNSFDSGKLLLKYCSADEEWKVYNNLVTLVQSSRLISNKCEFSSDMVLNGRRYKITEKDKTLRTLRKLLIALEYDRMDLFEKMQTAVSKIIDKKELKVATLCISIHPMDYFTMSDNSHGWSSCMSWMDEGSHHEGTIGCLGGEDCVVAYIKSDNPWGEIGWTSKKWRQLIAINPDGIITNRHYPEYRLDVQNQAVEMLRELAQANTGWEYVQDPISRSESRARINTGVMYSDFCNDETRALVYTSTSFDNRGSLLFNLATYGSCFDCGCEMDDGAGNLVCPECRGEEWCCECEGYVDTDYMRETADGGRVCRDCLDNYYSYCEDCGEWHYSNTDEMTYLENYEKYVCSACLEKYYKECDNCEEFHIVEEFEDGKTICIKCEKVLEAISEGENPSEE